MKKKEKNSYLRKNLFKNMIKLSANLLLKKILLN